MVDRLTDPTRMPDTDRHHCKYREERDALIVENRRLNAALASVSLRVQAAADEAMSAVDPDAFLERLVEVASARPDAVRHEDEEDA